MRILIILAVICFAVYWGYGSLTLEKIGKADETGMFGFLGESYEEKTPRDLGIEDLTIKEVVDWFKQKLSSDK